MSLPGRTEIDLIVYDFDGVMTDDCVIVDQNGILRNDGSNDLTPEEILTMDWFCDNVEGQIPEFDQLRPVSRETVRALGLYRQSLPQLAPKTEEKQL